MIYFQEEKEILLELKEKFQDIEYFSKTNYCNNSKKSVFITDAIYDIATDIRTRTLSNQETSNGKFCFGIRPFVYLVYYYKSKKFGDIEILSHDILVRCPNDFHKMKEYLKTKKINEKLIDKLIIDLNQKDTNLSKGF